MLAIDDVCNELEKFKPCALDCLVEVADLDITCKSILERYLNAREPINAKTIVKVQAIIDYMYEQVNIGNWKEVLLYIRKTITLASYLRVLAHFKCATELSDSLLRKGFKIVDFGIIFGCPLNKESKLLQNCATVLNCIQKDDSLFPSINLSCRYNRVETNEYNARQIEVLDRPSMEYFLVNHIQAERPVILENCINHWPAMIKWKDPNYFVKLAGLRTVAIELGKDYTDSAWTQKLMTIEEFVNDYMNRSDGPMGYLAQYTLFDQIPELEKDISQPDYCTFTDTNEPVDVMVWFGPSGTVSPLHHDPKRNLLAQVVGEKQVFLFSPKDTINLYPHEHELLSNTARVDPRKADLEKYPNYKDAEPYYCILRPGQMLYIPPKWWHFVESLSVSFSISFWWE